MKKYIFGVSALVLGVMLYTSPVFAETKSFADEMRQYAGRILSPDEIRKVLVGNTITYDRNSKRNFGEVYSNYWYYISDKVRQTSNSYPNGPRHESAWWASAEGYCHSRTDGKPEPYCMKIRVSIEGTEVKIIMVGKGNTRTVTLKKGKYSGRNYN